MLRTSVLALANRRLVRRAVTSGPGRAVALRFVAGEELDEAIEVVRTLTAQGAHVSLDYLGENVTDPMQAKAAAQMYLASLDRLASSGVQANLAVKLTQMGLDIDPELTRAHVEEVLARAESVGTTVTLDMEDHRYTDRTLDTCLSLAGAHGARIGVAVQTYLRRTPADVERLIEAGVHVRLCKGAYREPRDIAYHSRDDIDAAYARLTTRLLTDGAYPMIATHDERLIRHTIKQVEQRGRARDTFEFQMLYGVRRELQRRLITDGYRLRVYVPFGSEWYPYLMRRIAERPANIRFFVEALVRG